jgi:hypothetical protein
MKDIVKRINTTTLHTSSSWGKIQCIYSIQIVTVHYSVFFVQCEKGILYTWYEYNHFWDINIYFCIPINRTVYIYVSKYVRIRVFFFFSKPTGVREHKSLGNTGKWYRNEEERASYEQFSGGEKLYLHEFVSFCSGAVASLLGYGEWITPTAL